MSDFGLINKYSGLPSGEFKNLMSHLPWNLQEDFVLVVPLGNANLLSLSNKNVLTRRIDLPSVELRRDGNLMPIPPEYSSSIKRMEEIIQIDYQKSLEKYL